MFWVKNAAVVVVVGAASPWAPFSSSFSPSLTIKQWAFILVLTSLWKYTPVVIAWSIRSKDWIWCFISVAAWRTKWVFSAVASSCARTIGLSGVWEDRALLIVIIRTTRSVVGWARCREQTVTWIVSPPGCWAKWVLTFCCLESSLLWEHVI